MTPKQLDCHSVTRFPRLVYAAASKGTNRGLNGAWGHSKGASRDTNCAVKKGFSKINGSWCRHGTRPDYLIQVQRCAKHANREVCQLRSVVVELNPPDHAVFLYILRNLGFVDFQVLGQFRPQAAFGIAAASARPAFSAAASTPEVRKTDPKCLARFDVVVASEIGIGEDENAGTDGRVIRSTTCS